MRACLHYSKGGETYISSSGGYPWNAWVTVYSNGIVQKSTFQTGLIYSYLNHLKENRQCRRLVSITKRQVERQLKELEQVWQSVC